MEASTEPNLPSEPSLSAVSAEEITQRREPRSAAPSAALEPLPGEEPTDLAGSPAAARMLALSLADEAPPSPVFPVSPSWVLPGAWGTLVVTQRVEDELFPEEGESLEIQGLSDSEEGPIGTDSTSGVSLDVMDDLRSTHIPVPLSAGAPPPSPPSPPMAAGGGELDNAMARLLAPPTARPLPPLPPLPEGNIPPVWGTGEVAVVERLDEEDDLSLQSLELDESGLDLWAAQPLFLQLSDPQPHGVASGHPVWVHLLGPGPSFFPAPAAAPQVVLPPAPGFVQSVGPAGRRGRTVVVVEPKAPPPSAFEGSLEMPAHHATGEIIVFVEGSVDEAGPIHPVPVLDDIAASDAAIKVDLDLGDRSAPNRRDAHKGVAVAPAEPLRQWLGKGRPPEPTTDLRQLAEGDEDAPDDWLEGGAATSQPPPPSGQEEEAPMSPYYRDTHPGRGAKGPSGRQGS